MLTSEMNFATLQGLINSEREEDTQLEYKRAASLAKTDDKRLEIAKDVSALANSAGGTIIYGIAEHTSDDKRHLPEKFDPVLRGEISKEWLENVILSRITPRIDNITIIPVPFEENGERQADRVIYVVNIPESSTAHQIAGDGRYYKRFNFQSVPMQDFEVRLQMNKATSPRVAIEVSSTLVDGWDVPLRQLMVKIENKGERISQHWKVELRIPGGVRPHHQIGYRPGHVWLNTGADGQYILTYHSMSVLFPGEVRDLTSEFQFIVFSRPGDIEAAVGLDQSHSKEISWVAYADNMPRITGRMPISRFFEA